MQIEIIEMSEHSNWHTRIPVQDRQVVDAVAKWLNPIPWQWFVTLTFSWNVSGETADQKLKEWLNTVERDLKARVCFVAGKEHTPSSVGMEVPWHFHLLAASEAPIPQQLLERTWRSLAGRGTRRPANDGFVDDSVLVESYELNRGGPQYCLKSMNTCDGDWLFRWLELFNPLMKQTSRPNHDKIRQRARFDARQSGKQ
jgi:hypothetical protein